MSSTVGFFTPVEYSGTLTTTQSILQTADGYFCLNGKKALVIQKTTEIGPEKVVISETNSSGLKVFLKVVSYVSIVTPILMLSIKAIARSQHTFHVVDPQRELEKGMEIEEDTIEKIKNLMPNILRGEKNDEIDWLQKDGYLVFRLKTNPELIFKIPNNPDLEQSNQLVDRRFQNMIKAKEVCIAHGLGLLVIPQAKKLTIDGRSIIVERTLNFAHNENLQEFLHHTHSDKLKEAARQLAVFISKTGFHDINYQNITVLNTSSQPKDHWQIGLIDLERMYTDNDGITCGICQLISCAPTKQQIDAIVEEVRKQKPKVNWLDIQSAKEKRFRDLEPEGLNIFYKRLGIKDGSESFMVPEIYLNFSQHTPRDTEILKKLSGDLITAINTRIEQSPKEESVKWRRYIYIDTNDPNTRFYQMSTKLIEKDVGNGRQHKTLLEAHNETYLGCVVNELVKLGLIYSALMDSNGGYLIQV